MLTGWMMMTIKMVVNEMMTIEMVVNEMVIEMVSSVESNLVGNLNFLLEL